MLFLAGGRHISVAEQLFQISSSSARPVIKYVGARHFIVGLAI